MNHEIFGFSAGATVTLAYELGDCDKDSQGNCCRDSRNGEVKILYLNSND